MKVDRNNEVVTIYLDGHLDSKNANEIEKDIFSELERNPYKEIIINFEKLEYISSAGLRILLKLKKTCPRLQIVEVNNTVYEVLNMTGFTEMIDIQKSIRRLSVEGCPIIGEGSNGIVYQYDPETIIKVYKDANNISAIKRERELARKALILGIPTAISFDIVKVGNTYGSVFELLNAKSFSILINQNHQDIDKYITIFASILKKIHSTSVVGQNFDSMQDVAISWGEFLAPYISKPQHEKLMSLLKGVSKRETMIHGDYHTNNIVMQDEEVLLLDMDTLSYGHPIFDLGPMFLGLVGFGEIDEQCSVRFLGISYQDSIYIWNKTLEIYLETTDQKRKEEVSDKAKVISYTRLLRRTIRRIGFDDPQGAAIIKMCQERLADLLSRIDTLEF